MGIFRHARSAPLSRDSDIFKRLAQGILSLAPQIRIVIFSLKNHPRWPILKVCPKSA